MERKPHVGLVSGDNDWQRRARLLQALAELTLANTDKIALLGRGPSDCPVARRGAA